MTTCCANLKYDWNTRVTVGTGSNEDTLVNRNVITAKSMSQYYVDRVKIKAGETFELDMQALGTDPATTLHVVPCVTGDELYMKLNDAGNTELKIRLFMADVEVSALWLRNATTDDIYAWLVWGRRAT